MGANGFGFGHEPFGHFPFGGSDFGRNTILRSFPVSYLTDESGRENAALRHYLEVAAKGVNEAKVAIDELERQVNPNEVREDILRVLAETVAVTVDDYEPVEFRRSLVNNAVLFYRLKGTDEAYRIRGKISGYDVDVSNIWRIDEAAAFGFCEVNIGVGDGAASQSLAGNIGSYPVSVGSLTIFEDGVSIAQDDGMGGLVATGTYAITGTINYQTGDYVLEITPGVVLGNVIRAEFVSSVENEFVGVGDTARTEFIKSPLRFYPPYPGTLRVYLNGNLSGRDDGTGNIVAEPGAINPCTGTLIPQMGNLKVTFQTPPSSGQAVLIDYDKTRLAEFLIRYPDDIYEIPSDSGYWYSTAAPGLPGMPASSECGYCRTSFVKIKFTLVKSSAAVSGSSENFFDRLVRKIREVVPIHIRDLLYEIVIVIQADESQFLHATHGNEEGTVGARENEEITWMGSGAFHRFDVFAADGVMTDRAGYVQGSVEQVEE